LKQLRNDNVLKAEDQNKKLTPSADLSTAARENTVIATAKEDFLRDELTTSYEVVPQSPQNLSNFASNSQIRLDHGTFTSIDTMKHIENTDILTPVHSPLQPDEYTIEGERRSRMEPDGARNPSPDNIVLLNP
jgi:hypothetical protein